MTIISVHHLNKSFFDHDDTIPAISDISLEIKKGEMVAIIGPSGSGKTTLLNLIGNVTKPDSGEIIVDGRNTENLNDSERCKLRNQYFGYIVQDFALINDETGMENILIPAIYTVKKKEKNLL